MKPINKISEVPQISVPEVALITADITYRDKTLLQWCEGIVSTIK